MQPIVYSPPGDYLHYLISAVVREIKKTAEAKNLTFWGINDAIKSFACPLFF
jgi:hypothetical protein